ncbi:DMT family transporter [Streptomyces sp. NBC_01727]|uniref:DMT family transporter n=1 Tax=Streptomyces sp. NBC_01727 TaxID=2975924 RepID=UPI002E0FC037|nr:DMT family transporter [Streptomyces sp. NBC_01727]
MPTRSSPAAARSPRSGTALLVLAGLLWGTGGLAGSFLASRTGLQPVAVAAYRLLVGGALITAYAAAAGGLRTVPRTRAAAARVAATGALLAAYQTAYFAAVKATSVSLATLTTMVAIPVLVTVGSAALDRRPPTLRAAGSIVIAISGLMLLLGSPTSTSGNRATGAGLALLAALGFAALTLDRRAPLPGLDRDAMAGLGFLTGGLLLLPASLVSGMELPLRIDAVGAVVFLGLVPTAVAYTSYFAGLQHAGAAAGVVAVLLEPLTATLLAVLLGHDRLCGAQIFGAFLVMVSIGIHQAPTRTTATS